MGLKQEVRYERAAITKSRSRNCGPALFLKDITRQEKRTLSESCSGRGRGAGGCGRGGELHPWAPAARQAAVLAHEVLGERALVLLARPPVTAVRVVRTVVTN